MKKARYRPRSRLSTELFEDLVCCWVAGLTLDETATKLNLPIKTVKDNFSYIATECFKDFQFIQEVFFAKQVKLEPDDHYLRGTVFPFFFELIFSELSGDSYSELLGCALDCPHNPPLDILKAKRWYWPNPYGYLDKIIMDSPLPLGNESSNTEAHQKYHNRREYSTSMRMECRNCALTQRLPRRFRQNPNCRKKFADCILDTAMWLRLHPRVSTDYIEPLLMQHLLITAQVHAFEIFTGILCYSGELNQSFHKAMQDGQNNQFSNNVDHVLRCLQKRTETGQVGKLLPGPYRSSLIHDAYHYLVPDEYYRSKTFDPEGDVWQKLRDQDLAEAANPFRDLGT